MLACGGTRWHAIFSIVIPIIADPHVRERVDATKGADRVPSRATVHLEVDGRA
jgi:hypothetical protein